MKRIIRFLWTGQWAIKPECEHEWAILNTYSISIFGKSQPDQYDLQCKKCGDIKYTGN